VLSTCFQKIKNLPIKNFKKMAKKIAKRQNNMKKRSKKRNKLTTNKEITRLAYACHLVVNHMRNTITEINITASYRVQFARHLDWFVRQAKSLGNELDAPNPEAFINKEKTELIAEQLGLFD
jgi:hypothetical protein